MTTTKAMWWGLVPLALASCAYTSDYVPPIDGRARVVWRDGDPAALIPKGSEACRVAAQSAARSAPPAQRCAEVGGCGEIYWVAYAPIFEVDAPLPPIHDVGPGGVHGPTPGHPPAHAGTHQAMPVGTPKPSGGHAKALPSLGSSGGDGKGLGELLAVAAVIAIATMPIVAIALAASSPENEPKSAGAIDLVNAYNDQVRSDPNACLAVPYPAPPPPTPQPDFAPAPIPVPEAQP